MKNLAKILCLVFLASFFTNCAQAQKVVEPCYQVSGAPCQVVNSTHGLPVSIIGPISGVVNLGTSTSATSPRITGDATSGFYTAGAALVDVAISGSKITEWSSTGQTTTGLSTANGFSPTSSTATGNRLYLPSSNTPGISANGIEAMQWNTLASGVDYFSVTPGKSGTVPSIGIAGSTTNQSLNLAPAGAGSVTITAPTAGSSLDLSSNTNSLLLPVGTSAARPTGVNGMIRYNSSTNNVEGFVNGAWGTIGGNPIGSPLNSSQILVGSASNLAAAVTMSLDGSLSNTGALTVNSYGGGNVPGSSCAANTGTSGGTVPLLNSNNLSFSGTGDNFTNPIAIGTTSITTGVALDLGTNTNSMLLPVGTTGQRPTGVNGMVRYNSTTQQLVEGFINGAWEPISPSYPIDTTPGSSIGIGQQALLQQTSSAGYGNTAIGFQAMNSGITTAAVGNTAVGSSALKGITSGQRNTGVGNQAGDFISTGQFNTCVGRTSCGAVSASVALTGNDNTGMGDSTLGNVQGAGADNSGFGFKAGNAITTGTQNTVVGSLAGSLITTGTNNTVLGYQVASTTLTTGSSNIFIGTSSTTTANGAADTNEIAIAAAGLGSSTLTIAGIYNATSTGTASTSVPSISGTVDMPNLASTSAAQTGTVCWLTGSGTTAGRLTVDTTLACLSSLEELKDIHAPITNGLSIIKQLHPFWFSWKTDTQEYYGDKDVQPGLGAHQVESVDKRLAAYGPDGKLRGVRYQEITAVLVEAIQEQQSEIDLLKASKGIGHSCLFGLLICAD